MTRTVSSANQALLNPLGKTQKKDFFIGRTTKGGGWVKARIHEQKNKLNNKKKKKKNIYFMFTLHVLARFIM